MAELVHEDDHLFRADVDIRIADAADKAGILTTLMAERIPAAADRMAEVGPTITAHADPGGIYVNAVPSGGLICGCQRPELYQSANLGWASLAAA